MVDGCDGGPPGGHVTVIVEARDLDTDERKRETRLVLLPGTTLEQQRSLESAAVELHPAARLRSFANGAATLLDRQHLIVAFFGEPLPERSETRAAQEHLFA